MNQLDSSSQTREAPAERCRPPPVASLCTSPSPAHRWLANSTLDMLSRNGEKISCLPPAGTSPTTAGKKAYPILPTRALSCPKCHEIFGPLQRDIVLRQPVTLAHLHLLVTQAEVETIPAKGILGDGQGHLPRCPKESLLPVHLFTIFQA